MDSDWKPDMTSNFTVHNWLGFIYIGPKATSLPDGFIGKYNLMFTLSRDKVQYKNRFAIRFGIHSV